MRELIERLKQAADTNMDLTYLSVRDLNEAISIIEAVRTAKLPALPKTSGYEPDCDYPSWVRKLLTEYGSACVASCCPPTPPAAQ